MVRVSQLLPCCGVRAAALGRAPFPPFLVSLPPLPLPGPAILSPGSTECRAVCYQVGWEGSQRSCLPLESPPFPPDWLPARLKLPSRLGG